MTPDTKDFRVLLVANWLKRFASIYSLYGKTLQDYPEKFDEFLDAMQDLTPEEMDFAFRETTRHFKGPEFPTPAVVMGYHRERQERAAGQVWDDVQWILRTFCMDGQMIPFFAVIPNPPWFKGREHLLQATPHADGFLIGPKPFNAQIERAIQRVGGMDRLKELTGKEHDFVKRDFIETYRRMAERPALGPGRDEAKQLLEKIRGME